MAPRLRGSAGVGSVAAIHRADGVALAAIQG